MKKTLGSLVFLLIAALSLPVGAVVIYDNGGPNRETGLAVAGGAAAADDFMLYEATDVTDIHFFTLENIDRDAFWSGNLLYAFYYDNAGQPGTPVPGGSAVAVENVDAFKHATGVSVEIGPAGAAETHDEYEYWVFLEDPLPLDAGTTYWLALFLGVTSTQIFWETTDLGALSTAHANFLSVDWIDFGVELSYTLTGVPLPPTVALFALGGIIGLVSLRSRRRQLEVL